MANEPGSSKIKIITNRTGISKRGKRPISVQSNFVNTPEHTETTNVAPIKNRRRNLYFVYFTATLASAGGGMHYAWMNAAIQKFFDQPSGNTTYQVPYLPAVLFLGYLVGCPLSAFAMDRIGRKNTTLIGVTAQLITWAILIFSKCASCLYISRFFAGTASGVLFTIYPAYTAEISDPSARGFMSSSYVVGFFSGMLVATCLCDFLPLMQSAMALAVIPLLYLVFFSWIPESPYYSLVKRDVANAHSSLRFLRMREDVGNEVGEIRSAVQKEMGEVGAFWNHGKRLAFMVIFYVLTTASGFSALTVFTMRMLKNAGKTTTISHYATIVAVQLASVAFGSKMIDVMGRKRVLAFSGLASAVTLLSLAVYFHVQSLGNDKASEFPWNPTYWLALYFAVSSMGLPNMQYTLSGELFSMKVKAKTLALLTICWSITRTLSINMFLSLWNRFGLHVAMYVSGAISACVVPFALLATPETQELTLGNIQAEFSANNWALKRSPAA